MVSLYKCEPCTLWTLRYAHSNWWKILTKEIVLGLYNVPFIKCSLPAKSFLPFCEPVSAHITLHQEICVYLICIYVSYCIHIQYTFVTYLYSSVLLVPVLCRPARGPKMYAKHFAPASPMWLYLWNFLKVPSAFDSVFSIVCAKCLHFLIEMDPSEYPDQTMQVTLPSFSKSRARQIQTAQEGRDNIANLWQVGKIPCERAPN